MTNSNGLDAAESILVTTSVVGAGVVGGMLFAFSTFVMSALDTLDPNRSISAMQAINALVNVPAINADERVAFVLIVMERRQPRSHGAGGRRRDLLRPRHPHRANLTSTSVSSSHGDPSHHTTELPHD